MKDVLVVNESDFFKKYTCIKNPFNETAASNGCMFETYGDEYDAVVKTPVSNVWTIVEVDGEFYISAGLHIVNRVGFLITIDKWSSQYEEYHYE